MGTVVETDEKVPLIRVRANRGDSGSPQWTDFYFATEAGALGFMAKNDCLPGMNPVEGIRDSDGDAIRLPTGEKIVIQG